MPRIQDLNGDQWRLHAVGDPSAVPATVRAAPDIPARVPGCVHTDLIRAGLIPDPVVGFNELQVQWIGQTDWEYRRRFEADAALLRCERIDLVCDGLDTVAAVTLNGQAVGNAANMFHPHRFDIRGAVRPGENELVIRFASPLRHIRAEEARLGSRPVNGDWAPYIFIRTAACNFGWDWGPKLATSGIWKPIRIEGWDRLRIQQVRPLITRLKDDRWRIDTHIDFELAAADASIDGLLVSAALGPSTTPLVPTDQRTKPTRGHAACSLREALGPGYPTGSCNGPWMTARLALEVNNPCLWWPHRYGAPALYTLSTKVSAAQSSSEIAAVEFDIGFRTVRLVAPSDSGGTPFTLEVNGTPVFCLGANWIPEGPYPPTDSFFPGDLDREHRGAGAVERAPVEVENRLRDALDLGMNMLRVWGGGFYEHDQFYSVCDRLGIMVWQDFMFACAMYPEEAPYPALVEAEARHQVARLSSHPGVVLWCGGNECVWAHESWGAGPGETAWKDRLKPGQTWGSGYYFDLLPRLVSEIDPTRPYWPNSPWSGSPEIAPNDPDHGDRHTWDSRVDGYRTLVPRFLSEFGHQSPPNYSTLSNVLQPDDLRTGSQALDHRQRATGGTAKHIDLALAEWFRPPRDFDEWHYLSQLMQARALEIGIEWARANQPRCMGALIWQLNDCWPGFSWSLIDAQGMRKPACGAVKQAMQRRRLTLQPVDGRLWLFALNDSDDAWNAVASVRRMTFDGVVVAEFQTPLDVPARSAARVVEVEPVVGPPSEPTAEVLVADAPLKRAWWFYRPDRELKYPRPLHDVHIERNASFCVLRLRARSFLRDVVFNADRLHAGWNTHEDHPVSLLPGESCEFHWSGQSPLDARDTGNTAWETNLSGPPVIWCANYFGAGT